MLIVYGRRRIGKTELLEQTYCDRNIIKFEGIRGKNKKEQMEHVLWQLSDYSQQHKTIIDFLAKRKFATRNEILAYLKIKSSGSITDLLEDLELCGFVRRYTPFNLKHDSKLARYCLADSYLQYYYKFIRPIESEINHGDFEDQPTSAIKTDVLQKWMGFAFEKFCRNKHRMIAKILGFYAVRYRSIVYPAQNIR